LTTGRGSLAADAVEKKFSILSFSDTELGDCGGGTGAADGGAIGGGAADVSEVAEVAGPPNIPLPPPEHPDKRHASASNAAAGARSNTLVLWDRSIPRFIA